MKLSMKANNNLKLYQFHFVSTLPLIIVAIYGIYAISKADYQQFALISMDNNRPATSIFVICEGQDSITNENFRYQAYLDNANYADLSAIEKHITELDSLTKNNFLTQNIIVTTFTQNAMNQLKTSNLDSLNMLLNWADELRVYAKYSKEYDIAFQSIADFWYGQVSETLNTYIDEFPNRKFYFKYRFLAQRCADQQYLPNTGNTLVEKVILNTIDQNWAYLFHRFWHSIGMIFKAVCFLAVIVFTLISMLNLRFLIKQIKP